MRYRLIPWFSSPFVVGFTEARGRRPGSGAWWEGSPTRFRRSDASDDGSGGAVPADDVRRVGRSAALPDRRARYGRRTGDRRGATTLSSAREAEPGAATSHAYQRRRSGGQQSRPRPGSSGGHAAAVLRERRPRHQLHRPANAWAATEVRSWRRPYSPSSPTRFDASGSPPIWPRPRAAATSTSRPRDATATRRAVRDPPRRGEVIGPMIRGGSLGPGVTWARPSRADHRDVSAM